MKKIVIASACRTAIGKFGGTLANVPAVELGSIVIKEALSHPGWSGPERCTPGFSESRPAHRDPRCHRQRCLRLWPELCEHGCPDDRSRRC